MELKDLRAHEQEKYSAAEEAVDLGCTDTTIRRGRTKLVRYTKSYESGDVSLFSHRNKGRQPPTTVPQETDGEKAATGGSKGACEQS